MPADVSGPGFEAGAFPLCVLAQTLRLCVRSFQRVESVSFSPLSCSCQHLLAFKARPWGLLLPFSDPQAGEPEVGPRLPVLWRTSGYNYSLFCGLPT